MDVNIVDKMARSVKPFLARRPEGRNTLRSLCSRFPPGGDYFDWTAKSAVFGPGAISTERVVSALNRAATVPPISSGARLPGGRVGSGTVRPVAVGLAVIATR